MSTSRCETCQLDLPADAGWRHYRAGHQVISRLSAGEKREQVAEWRALAARAVATGQAGAADLFTMKANALERELT